MGELSFSSGGDALKRTDQKTTHQLTRLDFVLRESLTYRYPSPTNPSYIVRAPSQITDLVSASADLGLSAAVLYQQEPVAFEVEGTVPLDWKRMTVRTAKVRPYLALSLSLSLLSFFRVLYVDA